MTLINAILMAASFVWCGRCLKSYSQDPHWVDLLAAMASFLCGIYFFVVVLGGLALHMRSVAVISV